MTVRGFKSIYDEQHIEIAPLTILAGANSSGKSSIMQPLLLLKQTLEEPGDPGALLLDGPNVRFTRAEQILSYAQGRNKNSEFLIGLDMFPSKESVEVLFRASEGKGFEIGSMKNKSETMGQGIISPGMSNDSIEKSLPEGYRILRTHLAGSEFADLKWIARQERCFLAVELVSGNPETKFRGVYFDPSDLTSLIKNIIHLPGLRGNPQRNYPRRAAGPNFPGTFDRYVASVIAEWQDTNDNKLTILAKALETLGLTWNVKVQRVDDTQVELKVGRLPHPKKGGAHDLVSVADVGFGMSQSLPAVVALIVARPGQLVYLEQPEIHLHPLAQRKLAVIVAEAIKRGVIAVIETHSALFLREVQTLVAKGELSTDQVKLHWFQRDKNGCTTIKTADLDENGAYGDWPEDFDITELQAEQEYLDIVEARNAGKK